MVRRSYGSAIRDGFAHVLGTDPRAFVIGQGLWSPWYVGNSMTDLEIEFGKSRVIDTPVSEAACTAAALGAAVAGRRPIVVHPRMDFMVLALDSIVTQAAKWSSMFGGRSRAPMVVRGIINRGGQQGAQHSQALHAWLAHIPGLRVAMPATVADARDMLVSAVDCGDPVMYIDDRWLYELEADIPNEPDVRSLFRGGIVRRDGADVTFAGAGYSVALALQAAEQLDREGVSAEVVDLRVINPFDAATLVASVERTGRLIAVDGGWATCGLAAEAIARVAERLAVGRWRSAPTRICLEDAPAPTSGPLEQAYYPTVELLVESALRSVRSPR